MIQETWRRVLRWLKTSRLAQILASAILIVLIALSVAIWKAQTIQVQVDGKTVRVITLSSTVGEALAHTSLGIYPEDKIEPDRNTPIHSGLRVTVQRSVPLELKVDGRLILARSVEPNVGLAIKDLSQRYGLQLKDVDEVDQSLDAPTKEGMVINVRRADLLHVQVDGKAWDTFLAPRTVAEALAKLNITLGPKDKLSLAPDHRLEWGDTLKVVRVTEKEEKVVTPIPYQVVAQPADFPVGLPDKIITRGENGLQEQTVKVTLEDGKEVDREVLAQKITRPPVNQIVSRGTQTSVSRGGQVIQFQRAYLMRASAYSDPGATTATGAAVRYGIVAVDPRVIPLGTKLYIDGYGEAVALDTGGAIKGNRIDLYMDSPEAAAEWGVRTVIVYVR